MNFYAAERYKCWLNWGYPRNDLKQCQICTLSLTCPREPILIEVSGNISAFQGIIQTHLSILAINKFSNYLNDQKNLRFTIGPCFGPSCMEKKFHVISTSVYYTCFTKSMRHFEKPLLQVSIWIWTVCFRCRKLLKLFLMRVCHWVRKY